MGDGFVDVAQRLGFVRESDAARAAEVASTVDEEGASGALIEAGLLTAEQAVAVRAVLQATGAEPPAAAAAAPPVAAPAAVEPAPPPPPAQIKTACPACGNGFSLPGAADGRATTCPFCQRRFLIRPDLGELILAEEGRCDRVGCRRCERRFWLPHGTPLLDRVCILCRVGGLERLPVEGAVLLIDPGKGATPEIAKLASDAGGLSFDAAAAPTDPADLAVAQMESGTELADRYILGSLLRVDAVGAYYSARDAVRERKVTVRILFPTFLRDADPAAAQQAFERLLSLSHEGILRPYDLQHDAVRDLRFVTLEHTAAIPLSSWFRSKGGRDETTSASTALEIARQVLAALEHVHASTAHGWLYPENILLLDGEPRTKLFGFCNAASLGRAAAAAGRLDTVHYLAPEQRASGQASTSADLYAVAVLLYEMLVGKPPVGRFQLPSETDPDIPQAIDKLILRGLETDPAGRFPSARAFLETLDSVEWDLAGEQVDALLDGAIGSPLLALEGAIAAGATKMTGQLIEPPVWDEGDGAVVVEERPQPRVGADSGAHARSPSGSDSDSGSGVRRRSGRSSGSLRAATGRRPSDSGEQRVSATERLMLSQERIAKARSRRRRFEVGMVALIGLVVVGAAVGAFLLLDGRGDQDAKQEVTSKVEVFDLRPEAGASLKESTVEVSGIVNQRDLAVIYVNNATVRVDPDGRFSELVNLQDGENIIRIATGEEGSLPVTERTIFVDATPPDVAVARPVPGAVIGDLVAVVAGRVRDASGYQLTIDEAPVEDVEGVFSVEVPLAEEGKNVVTVAAVDRAGNAVEVLLPLYRDTTPPVIEVAAELADLHTQKADLSLSGNVIEAYLQEIRIAGRSIKPAPGARAEKRRGGVMRFDEPWALQDGPNTAVIEAIDKGGRAATVTVTVTLDTTPPELTVQAPSRVEGGTALLQIESSEPLQELALDDGAPQALLEKLWVEVEVVVAEGAQTFRVRGVDRAGNEATTEVRILRERATEGLRGEPLHENLGRGDAEPVLVYAGPGGVSLEMVYVPAGTFFMGDDDGDKDAKPRHEHVLEQGYWISRHEVTWADYLAFCEATGHITPPDTAFKRTDDMPVVNVSWSDARDFCEWLGGRLPSEPEWERAARGDEGLVYPWGDSWQAFANYCDASCPETYLWKDTSGSDEHGYLAPVGSYADGVSPYGAHDMAGNVWEWCEDAYVPTIYTRYKSGKFETPKRLSKKERVARGGSWASRSTGCRTFDRGRFDRAKRFENVGFRVALSPPGSE